jgi:arylsulfatase
MRESIDRFTSFRKVDLDMTNIAVVVLDTLRYDSFKEHFGWLEGRRFTNAYSTSHWTVPAHASLYTGYYPSEINVHGKSMDLDCELPVLPERFQSKGYTTQLLTSNPQIYIWDGWQRGYDNAVGPSNIDPSDEDIVDWDEFYAKDHDSTVGKYLHALTYCVTSDSPTLRSIWSGFKNHDFKRTSDNPLLRLMWNGLKGSSTKSSSASMLERLSAMDIGSNEFLFLNIMDTHTPYDPPEEYTDLQTPLDVVTGDGFAGKVDNPDELRQVYDDSVRYLSDQYQTLYQKLEKEFDYIITLSDHGEMLGENGMWNHSYGLYPELVRVPLVISGRNIEDRRDQTVVNLLDVHETICDIADIEVDSRGQNLLDKPKSKSRLFEYHGLLHWHRDQFKRKGIENIYEQYDERLDGFVSESANRAFQTHDRGLVVDDGLTATEAESKLENLIESIDRQNLVSKSNSDPVSAEVREQLENLGYA